MSSGANPNRQLVRRFGSSESRRDEIGQFDPRMSGRENFRRCAEAMEDFAKEPFARIPPAAFGEVLRATFAGEFCNFRGFSHTGVILPKPRHCRRIFRKPFLKCQRPAIRIDGQRRAAGSIHSNADHLLGFETTSPRVAIHSILGSAFYGAFAVKVILVRSRGFPGWALPVAGGLLFAILAGLWVTSSLYLFSSNPIIP